MSPSVWFLLTVAATGLSLSSAAWPFGSALKLTLFGRKCTEEEDFSEWSQCVWPKRHLGRFIDEVIRDAKAIGCKVPPPSMLKLAKRHLHANRKKIQGHPLFRLVPQQHCGYCGRQAKCCQKARSFMSQSFESRLCSDGGEPCMIDPIDDSIREKMAEIWPDVEPSDDDCDVSPWVRAELDGLKADVAYPFVKPLMCQILQTTEPSTSCRRVGDSCACCCKGYSYEEDEEGRGSCVQTHFEEDPECAED